MIINGLINICQKEFMVFKKSSSIYFIYFHNFQRITTLLSKGGQLLKICQNANFCIKNQFPIENCFVFAKKLSIAGNFIAI